MDPGTFPNWSIGARGRKEQYSAELSGPQQGLRGLVKFSEEKESKGKDAVEQLEQELDETFPPVTPTPDNNINMIMYKAGQRSVVEWYIQRLSKNNVHI